MPHRRRVADRDFCKNGLSFFGETVLSAIFKEIDHAQRKSKFFLLALL